MASFFSHSTERDNSKEESLKKHFDPEWIQNKVNGYIHSASFLKIVILEVFNITKVKSEDQVSNHMDPLLFCPCLLLCFVFSRFYE